MFDNKSEINPTNTHLFSSKPISTNYFLIRTADKKMIYFLKIRNFMKSINLAKIGLFREDEI